MLQVFEECSGVMNKLGYTLGEPVTSHEMTFRVEAGVSRATSRDARLGLRFMSGDGNYVVQFNLNGMVFSRIGNYDRWETFRAEAHRIWMIFANAGSVTTVAAVGVRYINKVFIPTDRPVEHYVRVYPHLPDEVTSPIVAMSMRLALPIANPAGTLIHTQMMLPEERPAHTTLLLDNDFQFQTTGFTSELAWELIERVREIKNAYFESFITDDLRKSFDA